MVKNRLGKTDIFVTRICFGALTIGPLQSNMPINEGAKIISYALDNGINFIDTAQLYETYKYIRVAMKNSKITPVISTKSYAYTKKQAIESLELARKELDMDVIDVFMLHEQESELTMKGHREALEYYLNEREKGRIKAVGVSTHTVEIVNLAAHLDEIDVIHPILNINGLGIIDGNQVDMLKAIKKAKLNNKGIYTMKPLGGGNIINKYDKCMDYLIDNSDIDSIAIGMKNINEVEMNIKKVNKQDISNDLRKKVSLQKRKLHIEFWCEKCLKCVDKCQHDALSYDGDKIIVEDEKCVLCGYCSSVCDVFAIKIY